MFSRLRAEFPLLQADRAYVATLIIVGLLTLLAARTGATRADRREDELAKNAAHARECRELMTTIAEDHEHVDPETVLGRTLSSVERAKARQLQLTAKNGLGMVYVANCWQVALPPSPLAMLSIGESDAWPDRYMLAGPSKAALLAPSEFDNPLRQATGPFDLAMFVVILLPLAVIIINHDVMSAEQDRGTWRLMASQPISVLALLMRRLVLRTAGVAAVIVGVTAAILIARGAEFFDPAVAWNFLLWSSVVTLYAAFWAALCWAVNSLGRSSLVNAVLLSVCWIVLVAVVPLTIAQQVAAATPVPPREAFNAREKEIKEEISDDQRQSAADFKQRRGDDVPAEEMRAFWKRRGEIASQTLRDRMNTVVTGFLDAQEQRATLLNRWGAMSPPLLMKAASDRLASNHHDSFLELVRSANDFQNEYQAYFESLGDDPLTAVDLLKSPIGPPTAGLVHPQPASVTSQAATLAAWTALTLAIGWALSRLTASR